MTAYRRGGPLSPKCLLCGVELPPQEDPRPAWLRWLWPRFYDGPMIICEQPDERCLRDSYRRTVGGEAPDDLIAETMEKAAAVIRQPRGRRRG